VSGTYNYHCSLKD